MKMVSIVSSLTLLLLLPIVASCNSAPGEHQRAQVKQTEMLPCFTVTDSEEARKTPPELAVISVFEEHGQGVHILWEISFGENGPDTILAPNACIVYGATPTGSKTKTSAVPLEVGKRYSLSIWSHILKAPNDEWRLRDYRAKFCLTKDAANETTVHQVLWNKEMDMWRWDVCGLENSP